MQSDDETNDFDIAYYWGPSLFGFIGDEQLIATVKGTRNSTYLADEMRSNKKISPALRAFVADVLDGTVPARPKRIKVNEFVTPTQIDAMVTRFERALSASDACKVFGVKVLTDLHYPEPVIDSAAALRRAAEFLVRDRLKISESVFDSIRYPRARSKKSPKKMIT